MRLDHDANERLGARRPHEQTALLAKLLLGSCLGLGRSIRFGFRRHGSVVRSWLLDLAAEALADDPSLAGVAASVHEHLDFEIFQGDPLSSENQLFDMDKHLSAVDKTFDGSEYAGRMFLKTMPATIGGQRWTFTTSTTPAFDDHKDRIQGAAE